MLQGLAIASGKLCIMLRFLETLIVEEGNLSEEEQARACVFLDRLEQYSDKGAVTLPGGLGVILSDKQLEKERWRFSLGLGDFLQIELNKDGTSGRSSSHPKSFFRAQVMSSAVGKGKINILVFLNKSRIYTVDCRDKRLARDGEHPVILTKSGTSEAVTVSSLGGLREDEATLQENGVEESKQGDVDPSNDKIDSSKII